MDKLVPCKYNPSLRGINMKKLCVLFVCAFTLTLCLSACTVKQDSQMVKSERRLGKYLDPSSQSSDSKASGMIDLSEGPRLKYDAHFGPTNPNFDIKVVSPY